MKNNYYIIEIIIALILVILAGALLNPMGLWMPPMAAMSLLVIFVLMVALFAGLIWGEKTHDEREMLLRHIASRLAYITGVAVVALGIVVQELQHRLDSWLITTLIVMVLAKLLGSIYARLKY